MKNKKTIIISIVIIIILACIIAVALNFDNIKKLFNNTNNEEAEDNLKTVIQNYIGAFYTNSSSESLLATVDAKAGYAWESCSGDTSAFLEAYESTTDEQTEEWKNSLVSSMQTFRSIRDMISESYSMELVSIDNTEELEIENLEKVTVTVKTTYLDEESNENEYTSKKRYYMYNGKVIAEDSIDETEEEE